MKEGKNGQRRDHNRRAYPDQNEHPLFLHNFAPTEGEPSSVLTSAAEMPAR